MRDMHPVFIVEFLPCSPVQGVTGSTAICETFQHFFRTRSSAAFCVNHKCNVSCRRVYGYNAQRLRLQLQLRPRVMLPKLPNGIAQDAI